jgi:hypothetical protein
MAFPSWSLGTRNGSELGNEKRTRPCGTGERLVLPINQDFTKQSLGKRIRCPSRAWAKNGVPKLELGNEERLELGNEE